jgi:putative flippase GtrA
VDLRPRSLLALARTPNGRRMVRYSLVSVVSVIVSQVVLFVTYTVLRVWTAVGCNFIACAVATGPSYYLNRNWAWGKSGKSHVWREVVPFWALAFLGLVFSLWAVAFAAARAHEVTDSRLGQGLLVNAAALAAFGVLWVGKFILFNKVLFAHSPDELELDAALDGRTGLPT